MHAIFSYKFLQAVIAASLCFLPVEAAFLEHLARLEPSGAKTTKIYFVRHGESIFNVPDANGFKTIGGRALDIPLTDRGLRRPNILEKN